MLTFLVSLKCFRRIFLVKIARTTTAILKNKTPHSNRVNVRTFRELQASVVPQAYSIRRISLKTEALHVATFQCVITAMETSGEFL